eukprot:1147386-Pelagomonas_calceolata.AAC.7
MGGLGRGRCTAANAAGKGRISVCICVCARNHDHIGFCSIMLVVRRMAACISNTGIREVGVLGRGWCVGSTLQVKTPGWEGRFVH